MNVLSVDLGTSNTVAVLSAHGRPPRVVDVDGASMMPSAVFAGEDGALVVGRDAERRARLDPSRFEPNPKRRVDEGTLLLGDQVVSVTEALAGVLRRVVDETTRQLGGAKPDEVRLTHPAQWGPVRRNVLLSAARQAGAGSTLALVPEPVAAAAHFASFPGQTLAPNQALAVYDLGAGTFDVAIVGATQTGFSVLAEAGLPDLGGLDVDQALLEHVGRQVSHRDPAGWQRLLRPTSTADRRDQRALREDVKAAKEALSRHPQTEVPLPAPFDDVLVTRTELEALIRPGMLRSVELLAATIRSTGMSPANLVGIYLVGGSSRIPLVATLIAEQLHVVPTSLDQPETAVALGAHHVPQEGITMRTGDMSGALDQARTRAVIPTRGTGFSDGATVQQPKLPTPQQQRAPQNPPSRPTPAQNPASGPNPVVAQQQPRSGPIPVQQPGPPRPQQPALQQHAPQQHTPQQQQHNPQQLPPGPQFPRQRQGGGSGKLWAILGSVGAVVLVAIVVIVIATSGGTTGPGGTDLADCAASTTTDAQGFTPCMRSIAGSVASSGDCESGMTLSGEAFDTPGATAATCTLGSGYSAIYYQFPNQAAVSSNIDQAFSGMGVSKSSADTATWSGAGLSGRYYAVEVSGQGLLLFTVDDTPLLGAVVNLSGGSDTTLVDYFNSKVKPGS
ncbi:Hsp70 family protein [Actinokineospora bangkokensis]|uniref:Molecular chaperone Hsp70 n=1 Tax=Actinokineospora bangkokensis TaxID=1193682 RepID=A0A1Q9LT22_9PSEU|nr:Hsp70 family protein [Actinokineospora bangkokensis]OLR95186.1 molecular chaperone Hsp70 [Actinokineospora bangkokensis]